MNRITRHFRALQEADRGAVIAYITAGFPELAISRELIRRADSAGTPVVEIGFPYSDSIADGPQIQESFHEALRGGLRVDDILKMVSELRTGVECGLVAMLSFSIVRKFGVGAFLRKLRDVGFDGVIIPDVSLEELRAAADESIENDLCMIGLVAPTTSPKRCVHIARQSSGFVYQIAVAGTTGERRELGPNVRKMTLELKSACSLPVCVGFGISTPEQVRRVCRVADGAIVGSAIIRRIRDGVTSGQSSGRLVDDVAGFIGGLVESAAHAREG